jgi:hypothetical protein
MALLRVEPIILAEARELTALLGGNSDLIPAPTSLPDVIVPVHRSTK